MNDRSQSLREPLVLLTLTGLVLLWSGIHPYERLTWWLEVFPVMIGAPLLIFTFSRFRLSPLLYLLLFLHAVILMIGGHYNYARVPVGLWAQDAFDLARNHYDRFAHFVQGFVPAILAREILLRRSPLKPGKWLFFLVVCICLAFSAFYEMLEWWAALLGEDAADSFLGAQGDIWDTQWDMFLAMIGAITSQWLLGRVHDRSMGKVLHNSNKPG